LAVLGDVLGEPALGVLGAGVLVCGGALLEPAALPDWNSLNINSAV
jgi:hypothetical protein